jgi:CRP-like cAMP-binding protein
MNSMDRWLANPAFPAITSIAAVNRLTSLQFFRGLDGAALARLSAGASEIDARGGSVIFRRGEPGAGLYLVMHGQVKLVLQGPQDAEKIIELVGPEGCFGGSALFLDRPHAMAAEALHDTRILAICKAAVLAELERTPAFANRVIASLSQRLQYLVGALEDCTMRSGTERVIGYLLDRVPGDPAGGEGLVILPEKKGVIASQLSLTHEHFSRILRALAKDGLVEVAGRSVRIRDVDRLRACCHEA